MKCICQVCLSLNVSLLVRVNNNMRLLKVDDMVCTHEVVVGLGGVARVGKHHIVCGHF